MSDTDELSSPLPPRAPAHAAMDLHSKLGHLNTGETILLLALWNCPQKVCIHCLFTSLVLPLPSLPLMPTLFSFLLWNRSTTCRYQADCYRYSFGSWRFWECALGFFLSCKNLCFVCKHQGVKSFSFKLQSKVEQSRALDARQPVFSRHQNNLTYQIFWGTRAEIN